MQIIMNTICTVTAFGMLSSLVVALIPGSSGLKQAMRFISGLICIVLILPIFNIDFSSFDFSNYQTQDATDTTYTNSLLENRMLKAVEKEITEKSKPILKKHGATLAKVAVDVEILDESGIFIHSVNYIVTDSLSAYDTLANELSYATGYICKVVSEEEQ